MAKDTGFFAEFKKFIARGNVMDMAVGVIIGGAFGKISTSLVNDIIMPAVSMLVGGINFSDWKIVLKQAVLDVDGVTELAPAVSINYGTFLSTILDFVIIGGAFGKISTSLVNDVIMPGVSMLTGGVDFSAWKIVLKEAVVDASGAEVAAEVAIKYGSFLATILDFLIIAFAVFCLIKFLNGLHKKKEEAPAAPPAPPEPSAEEKLLTEIRDLLKDQK